MFCLGLKERERWRKRKRRQNKKKEAVSVSRLYSIIDKCILSI
jgi:hypothetical protein